MSTSPRRAAAHSRVDGLPRLDRGPCPAPPVRMVHIGLGAFHRAHQAWYTTHAGDADRWGIAAFGGRGSEVAQQLREQHGVYTLVERGGEETRVEQIDAIASVHDADDTVSLRRFVASPDVSVITLTITEKGYWLDEAGHLMYDAPDVAADVEVLRRAVTERGATARAAPALRTVPARLAWALSARRAADAGPLALLSCDNLRRNDLAIAAAVGGMAASVDDGLAEWIAHNVDLVATSVDRITPRTTDDDVREVARATGMLDRVPVVTEAYASWVLAGRFRSARPRWEDAGAVFTEDVSPFEKRKLWMLNGAHSLLAYAGILRGFDTVAEAIADPELEASVRALWELDIAHLTAAGEGQPGELVTYGRDLLERFRNGAIVHHLRQIAADGVVKLRTRVAEVIAGDLGAGKDGEAGLRVVAAWVRFVQQEHRSGTAIPDSFVEAIAGAQRAADPVRALVRLVSPEVAGNAHALDTIRSLAASVVP